MTFGRPAMISKASSGAVPLPAAVDDDYIPSGSIKEVFQPPDRPSMMAFYAKSLELYEIMNDVLISLYKPISDDNGEDIHDFYFDNSASEGERTIFELDRSLTRWTRSLPPHLREDSSVSANAVFCRQSIVLRARFVIYTNVKYPPITKRCLPVDSYTCGCFCFGQLSLNTALFGTIRRHTH
jgi:hypothetical protein